MLKLPSHFLMLLALWTQYVAYTSTSGDTIAAIQSLESAVYFVGSVLAYLLLNTNKQGQ